MLKILLGTHISKLRTKHFINIYTIYLIIKGEQNKCKPSGIGNEISNKLLLSVPHRKDDEILESDIRVPACRGS